MSNTGLTASRIAPHPPTRRRTPFGFRRALVVAVAAGVVASFAGTAAPTHAAAVHAVPLGSAALYSVLAGSTVTNTGATVVAANLGLWPGTSVTGFPPGIVLAPGTIQETTAAAQQAQTDLTAAFVDASTRPVTTTTPADLVNQVLVGGVYAGPGRSPLGLSGPLVLDGAGDASSVFIFVTDSTLTTASASTVSFINGAQACNVFWVVGSSATLGTGSVFAGTILARDSITVTKAVTVHGRALARGAAVTLDNDTFTDPSCAAGSSGSTSTSTTAASGVTTPAPSTSPASPDAGGTTPGPLPASATVPGGGTVPGTEPSPERGTTPDGTAMTTPPVALTVSVDSTGPAPTFPDGTLPATGAGTFSRGTAAAGALALALGALAVGVARRRPVVR